MTEIVYYRCNYCFHVGVVVTDNKWFLCGGYRCGKNVRRSAVRVTKREYKRVWG